MSAEPLDAIPLPALLAIATGLLWVALEAGYRYGRWRRTQALEEREQTVGAIVASILGLVALVLGFTFSMVASRFDARRMGVLEEANAIGTTFLRTSFLPESRQVESARLLREYVDARLDAVEPTGHVEQAIVRSEVLQTELWAQAEAAGKLSPESITTGLYIQSLNQVIDLHTTRLVAARARIPMALWGALCFLSMLGMGAVGYQSALATTRRSPAILVLVMAFATVLYLIIDLDRSQGGLFLVSQQPIFDLQKSIQATLP
jgi:hypothetical protein